MLDFGVAIWGISAAIALSQSPLLPVATWSSLKKHGNMK